MTNDELDKMRDELDKMRDEVLRERFCELLWAACQNDKRRYVSWLETIAESRLPVDAMRVHLRSIYAINAAAERSAGAAKSGAESEGARKVRLALERERAIAGDTP